MIEKRAFEFIEAGSGKVLVEWNLMNKDIEKIGFWLYSTVVGEFAGDIDNTSFEDKHVKLPLMFRRGRYSSYYRNRIIWNCSAPENDEEDDNI